MSITLKYKLILLLQNSKLSLTENNLLIYQRTILNKINIFKYINIVDIKNITCIINVVNKLNLKSSKSNFVIHKNYLYNSYKNKLGYFFTYNVY